MKERKLSSGGGDGIYIRGIYIREHSSTGRQPLAVVVSLVSESLSPLRHLLASDRTLPLLTRSAPPPRALEKLRDQNRFDIALYEWAKCHFEKKLSEFTSSDSSMLRV